MVGDDRLGTRSTGTACSARRTGGSGGTGSSGGAGGGGQESRLHARGLVSTELEQLADAADRVAPGPGLADAPGAQPEPAPAASPNLAAIGFLLTTFRTLAGAIADIHSLEATLDDQKIAMCAGTLAPVADKYGIDFSSAFAGPEAAAIMVAGPVLWEAARQLSLELKAKRAKPVEPAPDDGRTVDQG